jgi:hypothetical protein
MHSWNDFKSKELQILHFFGHADGYFCEIRTQEKLWSDFAEIFKGLQTPHSLEAFLLMSNHFHGVLTLTKLHQTPWVQEFCDQLEQCQMRVLLPLGLKKIESKKAYFEVIKYIFRNPVESRLSKTPFDYEFSSLFELMGRSKQKIFNIKDRSGIITNPFLLF